ncbi:19539_t:CDS:2, partial [Gigaspora margarita]
TANREASSSINEREEEIRSDKKEKSKENYNKKIDCLDLVENIQETSDEKEYKKVLLLTECRISNYSTKKVHKQLTENKVAELAKHNDLTESILRNIKQATVLNKIEVDQDKEVEGILNQSPNREFNVEDINSSIWASITKSLIKAKKGPTDRVKQGEEYKVYEQRMEYKEKKKATPIVFRRIVEEYILVAQSQYIRRLAV